MKLNIKKLNLTAMFFALIIILSILETYLPPLPVPGAKIGIANMVIMYSLLMCDKKQALTLVILKSVFAFFTRGVTAALLSFSGGIFSFLIAVLLLKMLKDKLSLTLLCVSSAVFHNIGQFVAALIIMNSFLIFPYFAPLILFGVVFGICSAVLLKLLMPYLKKIHRSLDSNDYKKGVF